MNPYDEVVRALQALIAKSGPQLGKTIVLTERNLQMTGALMERLDEDSSTPLATRIRNEVVGAGVRFHTVTIKFPSLGPYDIVLEDSGD
jgi:hypothetical protein